MRAIWRWVAFGVGVAAGACWAVGTRQRRRRRERQEAELAAAAALARRPGQRFVVLAGARGVGKSALANALLGCDLFGPAAEPALSAQYRELWWLRELPAAAVELADPALLRPLVGAEDVLVLVTAPDPEATSDRASEDEGSFLTMLAAHFAATPRLVCANKLDRWTGRLTARDAAAARERLGAAWAPHLAAADDVVWGAANGLGGPELTAFTARLDELLQQCEAQP
jgi:hypothetical protein